MGLPAEGLSRARIARLYGGAWRHRFLLGRGMLSDDTEHTLFAAQALLAHPSDAVAFQRALAWKLRLWLVCLPAGVGFATLRAIGKLWLGFPPRKAGVWSAGNGPAMRSAVLGGFFASDEKRLREYVRASSELTHKDPRAHTGALAIAVAAARAVQGGRIGPAELTALAPADDREWPRLVGQLQQELAANSSVAEFCAALGLARGVTGYVYNSVPVALYAWLRHEGDYRATLGAVWDAGGDTDTVGAIAGALAGASAGTAGIPHEWLAGIADWPRSTTLLRRVAERLARQRDKTSALGPVPYAWPLVPLRNALFLAVVLLHGFRRLLPPY